MSLFSKLNLLGFLNATKVEMTHLMVSGRPMQTPTIGAEVYPEFYNN